MVYGRRTMHRRIAAGRTVRTIRPVRAIVRLGRLRLGRLRPGQQNAGQLIDLFLVQLTGRHVLAQPVRAVRLKNADRRIGRRVFRLVQKVQIQHFHAGYVHREQFGRLMAVLNDEIKDQRREQKMVVAWPERRERDQLGFRFRISK